MDLIRKMKAHCKMIKDKIRIHNQGSISIPYAIHIMLNNVEA